MSAKKRAFARNSDSITIFAFLFAFNSIFICTKRGRNGVVVPYTLYHIVWPISELVHVGLRCVHHRGEDRQRLLPELCFPNMAWIRVAESRPTALAISSELHAYSIISLHFYDLLKALSKRRKLVHPGANHGFILFNELYVSCLLYTSPSPRDA